MAERDNRAAQSAKGLIVKLPPNSSVSLINDFCTNSKMKREELSVIQTVMFGARRVEHENLVLF